MRSHMLTREMQRRGSLVRFGSASGGTWVIALVAVGVAACGARAPARPVSASTPAPAPAPAGDPAATAPACDADQAAIRREADARATPWSIDRHLAKNFPGGRVAWIMTDARYQESVVKPGAKRWGRCNAAGCYQFAAPAAAIHDAVARSKRAGGHDAAALGKALGLPAANLEGPLRMMTLDLRTAGACVRLPVERDPGAWPCKSAADTECFKFGGYTSGGVPEVMIVDAPVDRATIEEVP